MAGVIQESRKEAQRNGTGPCFSRQVSMYLAKRVGRWSLSQNRSIS
jgi:hypothetical protein